MDEARLGEIEAAHWDCTDRVGCYALAMVDEIRRLRESLQEIRERYTRGGPDDRALTDCYALAVAALEWMPAESLPVKRSELDDLASRIAALENRMEGQDDRLNALDVADWKRAVNAMDAGWERRDRLREIAAQSLQTFISMGLAPDLAAKQAYNAALELLHLIEWDERGGR